MKRQVALFLALVAWQSPAWGIGRTGNGSLVGADIGFQAHAPESFPESRFLSQDSLRLIFPGWEFSRGNPFQPFIEVSPLGKYYPELAGLSRVALGEHFTKLAWTKVVAHQNDCVEIFRQTVGQGFVVAWGPGKGISLIGPESRMVERGQKEILDSLELLPGACAW